MLKFCDGFKIRLVVHIFHTIFPLYCNTLKKTHTLWNTPRRIYTVVFLSRFLGISIDEVIIDSKSHSPDMANPKKTFLTWWPWPLTYDPDLQTWPRYFSTRPACQNSGPYVCPFGRERGNTHTDRHTMSKLLHPSLTRGVKSIHPLITDTQTNALDW